MSKEVKAYIKTIEIMEEDGEEVLATLEAFEDTFEIIFPNTIYSPKELRGIADALEKAERYAKNFYKEYEGDSTFEIPITPMFRSPEEVERIIDAMEKANQKRSAANE